MTQVPYLVFQSVPVKYAQGSIIDLTPEFFADGSPYENPFETVYEVAENGSQLISQQFFDGDTNNYFHGGDTFLGDTYLTTNTIYSTYTGVNNYGNHIPDVAPVPLPASVGLMLVSLAGLYLMKRRVK